MKRIILFLLVTIFVITTSAAIDPQIEVRPGTNVRVGEQVYFDATNTTGLTDVEHCKFEWDFGDGYAFKEGFPNDNSKNGGITCLHYFMKPGEFNVMLKVTSSDGEVDSISKTISVEGEEPVDGFELWHAPFHARIAQYIYAQIPMDLQGLELKVTLEGSNGYSETIFQKVGISEEEKFLLQNSELPADDEYILTAEILDGGEHITELCEYFAKPYEGIPKVGINKNNAICIDGDPFIPVTPFILNKSRFEEFQNTINCTYSSGWYSNHTLSTFQDYLNSAWDEGWYSILCVRGMPNYDRDYFRNVDPEWRLPYIEYAKDHPGFLAYITVDEPTLGGRGTKLSSPVLSSWSYIINNNDGQHPTVVNQYGYRYLPYYTNNGSGGGEPVYDYVSERNKTLFGGKRHFATDITGFDIYPLEYGQHSSLDGRRIMDQYVKAINAFQDKRYDLVPAMSFVEMQDIRDYRGTPPPTPDQLLMEAWLNIVHGMKGINWFNFFEVETRTEDHVAAMAKFCQQMGTYDNIILSKSPVAQPSDNANEPSNRVDLMYRTTNDGEQIQHYIFAVRLTEPDSSEYYVASHEPENINVDFDMNGIVNNGTVTVEGEDREIQLNDGTFSDNFDKCDVHIYRIDGGTPPDDYPPIVENPIPVVEVDMNSPDVTIDLTYVFTDPDNNDQAITKTLHNNDNETLVAANLEGNTLTLDFLQDQNGTAHITIRASSNGKTVDHELTVNVSTHDYTDIEYTAYWDFATGSANTAYDVSDYENDGLISGATWTNAGIYGNALSFDGDDTVYVGDSYFGIDESAEFSVTLWFKFPDLLSGRLIYRGETYHPFAIKGNSEGQLENCIRTEIEGDNSVHYMTSTLDLNPNEWYHCVLTYQDGDSRVYINGELNTSDKITGVPFLSSYTEGYIGSGFTGTIDEVGIIPQAITAEDVNDIYIKYTTDSPPVVSNPIQDIEVPENAPNTEIDLSNVFTDPDNDNSAISKTVYKNDNDSLVIANIDEDTLLLDYQQDQHGIANIVIRANSNGKTVNDTLQVTVNSKQEQPVFTSVLPDTTVDENTTLSYTYQANDPNEGDIEFGISRISLLSGEDTWEEQKLPINGLNLDSSSGDFNWDINYKQAGKYRVKVYARNTEASAYNTTMITINNINQEPEFVKAPEDTTIDNDTEFTFKYKAQDKDGDSLFFGLNNDTIAGLSITKKGELSWSIPETPPEEYTISAFVSDSIDTVSTSARITINNLVAIDGDGNRIPDKYSLSQNYPNPFNPTTTIKYGLPEQSDVIISIYDINGSLVEKVSNNSQSPGFHTYHWNASKVSSGIYFYRIKANNFTQVRKCILLK